MKTRKHFGEVLSANPDDAPELTQAFCEDAEVRHGETVIRPYRGYRHPNLDAPKWQVAVDVEETATV